MELFVLESFVILGSFYIYTRSEAKMGTEAKEQEQQLIHKIPALRTCLLCVMLDMAGVGLVIPCLVSLTTSLGATPSQYGLISSLYGLGQLFGCPLLGSLSDKTGRKAIMIASFVGSMLAYGLMGVAWSLWVVCVARVMVGVMKQTTTLATAYISEITNPDERTGAMAKLSTMTGMGFIVGPILGSIMARYSLRLPFLLSAALFAIDIIVCVVFLPNVKPDPNLNIMFDPTCPITGKRGVCIASQSEKEDKELVEAHTKPFAEANGTEVAAWVLAF